MKPAQVRHCHHYHQFDHLYHKVFIIIIIARSLIFSGQNLYGEEDEVNDQTGADVSEQVVMMMIMMNIMMMIMMIIMMMIVMIMILE